MSSLRTQDREVLRTLASRWMEIALQPEMAERKRQWSLLKDLRPERPMVLFETWTLEDYLADVELLCEEPLFRQVEWQMRWNLRQAEEVGDDIVLEPCWREGWEIHSSGYGVDLKAHHSSDHEGMQHGYNFNHPIRSPADLDLLRPRTWSVDREETARRVERLSDAFGDILPVELHGTSGLHIGLTGDVFRMIGNDNLLVWPFDEPEALHRLMAYLRDDRLAYFDWLEREGLLGLNNHWTLVGSGSPGYTTALPAAGYAGATRLKDLWIWSESQETTMISPAMFDEFFLTYIAKVAERFGLVYYGCCEPVHDRWDRLIRASPHIRAVSISPWCDRKAMAELAGQSVVFSRKPPPAPITGPNPDWVAIEKELDETLAAFEGCSLEIIYRDVYRIHGDRPRLRRWTDLVRSRIGQ